MLKEPTKKEGNVLVVIVELSNSSRNVANFPPLEAIRVLALESDTKRSEKRALKREGSGERGRRRSTEWVLVVLAFWT